MKKIRVLTLAVLMTACCGAAAQNYPVKPIRFIAPITLLAMVPNGLVVHPSLPAHSVREFLALARAKPKALLYGSGGNGSAAHLTPAYFEWLAKSSSRTCRTRAPGRRSYQGRDRALGAGGQSIRRATGIEFTLRLFQLKGETW